MGLSQILLHRPQTICMIVRGVAVRLPKRQRPQKSLSRLFTESAVVLLQKNKPLNPAKHKNPNLRQARGQQNKIIENTQTSPLGLMATQ